MLFGGNVHNTGAGYNSCRNLEGKCAAMGKLPGQTTPTVISPRRPKNWTRRDIDRSVDGRLGAKGCPPSRLFNDDIYFFEVCAY